MISIRPYSRRLANPLLILLPADLVVAFLSLYVAAWIRFGFDLATAEAMVGGPVAPRAASFAVCIVVGFVTMGLYRSVVVPGDSTVDLKLLAATLGEKKVHLPTEREAEQLTGLQAGGISPLALLNKGFQVVIDSSAQAFAHIHISGGQRGLNIKLPVPDLVKLTNARLAPISRPEQKTRAGILRLWS